MLCDDKTTSSEKCESHKLACMYTENFYYSVCL